MTQAEDFKPFAPRVVARNSARSDRAGDLVVSAASAGSEATQTFIAPSTAPSQEISRTDAGRSLQPATSADAPVFASPSENEVEGAASGDERCALRLRARAIEIAGIACARALHLAIARNPLFVARFVDDALEAAGRPANAVVRLSTRDAAACGSPHPGVIADATLGAGDVIIDADGARLGATIEERALILAASAGSACALAETDCPIR